MTEMLEAIVELNRRVQLVREMLQWSRLELEAIDRRVVELARQEAHHGV